MPALRQLAALQKEEQALQFLRVSGPQLQPVFASLGLDLSAGLAAGCRSGCACRQERG